MSKESSMKKLDELNKMIEKTQSELDKLENKQEEQKNNDLFLRD